MKENIVQSLARYGSPFVITDLKGSYNDNRFIYNMIFGALSQKALLFSGIMNFDVGAVARVIFEDFVKSFKPGVFTFYYNPNEEHFTLKKLATAFRLGFGYYDVQYFESDLLNLTLNGIIGNIFPSENVLKVLNIANINVAPYLLSPRYYKFLEMEFYINNVSSLLAISLIEKTYIGFITNFDWNWSADNPYKITYTLTFSLFPQPIFTGMLFTGHDFIQSNIREKLALLTDRKFLFYSWE